MDILTAFPNTVRTYKKANTLKHTRKPVEGFDLWHQV